jgi:hypothetical protein
MAIIPSGLPHQMFVSLIGTYGMGSDPLCCEGIFSPSTKLALEGGPNLIVIMGISIPKVLLVVEIFMQSKFFI